MFNRFIIYNAAQAADVFALENVVTSSSLTLGCVKNIR